MRNQNKTIVGARFLLSVALTVVLVLASDPAMAWGKKKKEPKNQPTKAVNLDKHPTMAFFKGVLRLDNFGDWSLDNMPMSFSRNSRISDTRGSEGGTVLIEGRTARVTAAKINGTLIVHRVTMISPDEMLERGGSIVGLSSDEPLLGDPNTPR